MNEITQITQSVLSLMQERQEELKEMIQQDTLFMEWKEQYCKEEDILVAHEQFMEESMRQKKVDMLLSKVRIPRKYNECTLRGYETLTQSQKVARDICIEYLTVKNNKKSLFIAGNVGVGKSHLAIATLKKAISQTLNEGYYINLVTTLQLYRDTISHNTRGVEDTSRGMYVFLRAKTAVISCIDEIAVNSEWEWERFYELVEHRYSRELPTIFTSNFTLEYLEKTSKFINANRIVSRLSEMCDIIHISGPDYRRK